MTQRPMVWLAGYPSSGNLKAQIGIANLLFGRVTSIRDLDTKIPVMTPSPAIPECPPGPPFNIVFTHHLANSYLLSQRPTAGIVYVIRHPVDAGISSSGYLLTRSVDFRTASDDAIAAAQRAWMDQYLQLGSFMPYVTYGYGHWQSHVLSWLQFAREQNVPFHLVPFDDMRNSGDICLKNIAAFLGLAPNDAQIADAIDNWSMPASRAMEDAAIASQERCRLYKPAFAAAYARGWRYHGKGGSGYGKDQLSPEQWQRAHAMFAPIASQFGYNIAP